MIDDAPVRETRRVRDELASKLNYDAEAIIRDLMARQREISEGHVMVQNVNERVPTAKKDE